MASFGFFDPWGSDPWSGGSDFTRLRRELDSVFDRLGGRSAGRRGVFPAVNLYEDAEGYVLTAEVPGCSREDIDVSVEGNRITLSGKRSVDVPENASVHRRERAQGSFKRTVELPAPLDAEKTEAVYRHGVLMVRVPKAESHQPRRIQVGG